MGNIKQLTSITMKSFSDFYFLQNQTVIECTSPYHRFGQTFPHKTPCCEGQCSICFKFYKNLAAHQHQSCPDNPLVVGIIVSKTFTGWKGQDRIIEAIHESQWVLELTKIVTCSKLAFEYCKRHWPTETVPKNTIPKQSDRLIYVWDGSQHGLNFINSSKKTQPVFVKKVDK